MTRTAQAWIELVADDPEAVSALHVARAHLPAGAKLTGLRRVRLVELQGALPARDAVAELLHRSTWFYNPHKERCTLRTDRTDPAPVEAGAALVLVSERGGERRTGAERWWRHETGVGIEVREATAWVLRFDPGEPAEERAADLATVRDRRHGLFCNPHFQDAALAGPEVPLPWIPSGAGASRSITRGEP